MAGKREKPEDIVLMLRQVEMLQGQGKSVQEAVRQIGVTARTYYQWRKEYGGMSRDQLRRLKELEVENQRLRRAVSDMTLDKLILTEASRGTEGPRSETSEPFASPPLHRPCAADPWRIRASRCPAGECMHSPRGALPHTRAASFDAGQGALRPARRWAADRGHHRIDATVRTLWLSHDHRHVEQC